MEPDTGGVTAHIGRPNRFKVWVADVAATRRSHLGSEFSLFLADAAAKVERQSLHRVVEDVRKSNDRRVLAGTSCVRADGRHQNQSTHFYPLRNSIGGGECGRTFCVPQRSSCWPAHLPAAPPPSVCPQSHSSRRRRVYHAWGIPNARFYMNGDKHKVEELAREVIAIKKRLALQAGGRPAESDCIAVSVAATTAHLGRLAAGWSARGDRDQALTWFQRHQHGSTDGSLRLPSAGIDPQLKAVFTNTTKQDVLVARPILYAALASDALANSTPLRNLIASYVDHTMIRRIAEGC